MVQFAGPCVSMWVVRVGAVAEQISGSRCNETSVAAYSHKAAHLVPDLSRVLWSREAALCLQYLGKRQENVALDGVEVFLADCLQEEGLGKAPRCSSIDLRLVTKQRGRGRGRRAGAPAKSAIPIGRVSVRRSCVQTETHVCKQASGHVYTNSGQD